jgi:Flp pilus assembly protein TadB
MNLRSGFTWLLIACLGISSANAGADAIHLEREKARAALVSQGIDERTATARVAALTDDEAAVVAAGITSLPAGAGGVEAVAGLYVYAIALAGLAGAVAVTALLVGVAYLAMHHRDVQAGRAP